MSLVSSYAVCFLQQGGVSLASSAIIYNIVKVTCWPVDPFDPLTCRPVDLSTCWPFRKRTPQGNCEVHLHTPLRCDPLTRRPVDLFEKEPLKGKWEVNLHTPTKFGEDPSEDLGGDREHTHKHTNKRCSNYSMMMMYVNMWKICSLINLIDDVLCLQALGSLYFIHQSVQNVQIYDFKGKPSNILWDLTMSMTL